MATKKNKTTAGKKWAVEPFEDCINDLERLREMVYVSTNGISMLRGMPRVVEALVPFEEMVGKSEVDLEFAKKTADLAQREVEEGFPLLHAWAVVAVWAYLEAHFRTFLAIWLKRRRSAWSCEPIKRLKVKLGDYESIPPQSRHFFVIGLLERELGTGIRNGVDRFEAMLEPFELAGPVPKKLKDAMYELGQVRNIIVHNASRVDRQFKSACPWFPQKVGSTVNVSSEMLHYYMDAVVLYVTLLICRPGPTLGLDMSKHIASVEEGSSKLAKRPVAKRRRPRGGKRTQ